MGNSVVVLCVYISAFIFPDWNVYTSLLLEATVACLLDFMDPQRNGSLFITITNRSATAYLAWFSPLTTNPNYVIYVHLKLVTFL